MSSPVIHFPCPSCQARLTVPEKLAGIEGPCPKCGAPIKAPEAEARSFVSNPATAPEPVKTSPQTRLPETRKVPPRPEKLPDQPSIRPEPRGLPDNRPGRKVSARHSTADMERRPAATALRSEGGQARGIGRFFIPAAFLLAGGGLAFFLLYEFMPGGPGRQGRSATSPPAPPPESPVKPVKPVDPVTAPPADDTPVASRFTPNEDLEPTVPIPPSVAATTEAVAAEDALEDFVRATSLGARLPMIEPEFERDELVGTIVDGIMPEALTVTSGSPDRDTLEDFVDYPFRVNFRHEDETTEEVLVIVRKRGDGKPKVLVEPQLDLLGDRLAKFAAAPVEGPVDFRAVIEAMPRCFESDIPNPDRKFTYKLSSSDRGGEIARAYASLNSHLAEQLFTPDSEIRWGKRVRATVTLEWNMIEDPEKPFIDLLEIKSLNWSH